MAVNILAMKWGRRYSPDYVNRLHASVARHIDRPFRFHCFTDDRDGLHAGIECHPLPDTNFPERSFVRGAWPKIGILKGGLANLAGQCLFLDLDIVIRRSLGDLFEYGRGSNCFIKDWEQPYQRLRHMGGPRIANTSVFRFEADSLRHVYDAFARDRESALGGFRNEQRFLSAHLESSRWWPSAWIASFKRHCIPTFPGNLLLAPREPRDARIVVFHGRPNPHEALAGCRRGRVHRWVRPAGWIADHWLDRQAGGGAAGDAGP